MESKMKYCIILVLLTASLAGSDRHNQKNSLLLRTSVNKKNKNEKDWSDWLTPTQKKDDTYKLPAEDNSILKNCINLEKSNQYYFYINPVVKADTDHNKCIHDKDRYYCNFYSCNFSSKWQRTVFEHINKKHYNLIRYASKISGYTTHTKKCMKEHITSLENEKNYKCSDCGMGFSYYNSFYYHTNRRTRPCSKKEKRTVKNQ